MRWKDFSFKAGRELGRKENHGVTFIFPLKRLKPTSLIFPGNITTTVILLHFYSHTQTYQLELSRIHHSSSSSWKPKLRATEKMSSFQQIFNPFNKKKKKLKPRYLQLLNIYWWRNSAQNFFLCLFQLASDWNSLEGAGNDYIFMAGFLS